MERVTEVLTPELCEYLVDAMEDEEGYTEQIAQIAIGSALRRTIFRAKLMVAISEKLVKDTPNNLLLVDMLAKEKEKLDRLLLCGALWAEREK